MLNPRLRQQLAELNAIPSVACTMAEQDMSNLPVIHLLANWFESAGFVCEIMPVADGKANLIAVRAGTDPEAGGGLVLAGHHSLAHIPRIHAVFLCVPFGYSPVMAGLKGDTFACASNLVNLSANPFPPCHPYLAVSGKASMYSLGVSPND